MKKRFLSLGLAAVMAMSLTACGGSNTAETTKAAETTAADAKAEGSEAADTAAADAGAAGGVFKIGGHRPCNRRCGCVRRGCTARRRAGSKGNQ